MDFFIHQATLPVYRFNRSKCVEWEIMKGIGTKNCAYVQSCGNKLGFFFFHNPDNQQRAWVQYRHRDYGCHLEVKGKF